MWQQQELASEIESYLRDTADLGRKWVVRFNVGINQLVSFDQSSNTGAIDVKMDECLHEEKSSFKMLGLALSSKLDWGSYIISIAKTASNKIGALIRSISFFLLRLLCVSVNLPNCHTWTAIYLYLRS